VEGSISARWVARISAFSASFFLLQGIHRETKDSNGVRRPLLWLGLCILHFAYFPHLNLIVHVGGGMWGGEETGGWERDHSCIKYFLKGPIPLRRCE
jgi:hypothetical protein